MPEPNLGDVANKIDATRQEVALARADVAALAKIMVRQGVTIDKLEKVIVEVRSILPKEFVRMGATYRVR